MDPALERLFRLREARDMEIDAELKKQLHENFLAEVKRLVSERELSLEVWEFVHAMSPSYHQWKHNPH